MQRKGKGKGKEERKNRSEMNRYQLDGCEGKERPQQQKETERDVVVVPAVVIYAEVIARADETAHLQAAVQWDNLYLPEALQQGIYEMGFVKPSKIQAAALPLICSPDGQSAGGNLIGQAQNGSGKTATFCLGCLSMVNTSRTVPQALIVLPTRELVRQVDAVINQLGRYMQVQTCMIVAGDARLPRDPQCQVVIGTPGKLQDLIKRKAIQIGQIKTLVLDEADQLLDQTASMGPQVFGPHALSPSFRNTSGKRNTPVEHNRSDCSVSFSISVPFLCSCLFQLAATMKTKRKTR